VPASIAGMQGPCPKCWQEIVSPDPAHGLPARLPPPPPVAMPAAVEVIPPTPESVLDERPAAVVPEPPPVVLEKKRSKLLLALAISLPAVALAAVGFHFGKNHRQVVIEAKPTARPAVPVTPDVPAPDETAPRLVAETPEPPPPAPSEAADAEATLRAFLGAPDWKARSAFVFFPEDVRPAMAKHAAEHGDGPIPANSFQLADSVPPHHVFTVHTKAIPEGFPVAVTMTTEGPKIGWDSFIGFHDDHFKKLLDGPADRSGIFDVLVKPSGDPAENAHYERFQLSVPMPDRETVAFARRDSVALARLRGELNGSGSFDPPTVERMISGLGGVPLVLALAKRSTPDGKGSYIEIADLVAVQWGHRAP
jgi:hypothetical protein